MKPQTKTGKNTFEEHHWKLGAGKGEYRGANPEDPDEHSAVNVF